MFDFFLFLFIPGRLSYLYRKFGYFLKSDQNFLAGNSGVFVYKAVECLIDPRLWLVNRRLRGWITFSFANGALFLTSYSIYLQIVWFSLGVHYFKTFEIVSKRKCSACFIGRQNFYHYKYYKIGPKCVKIFIDFVDVDGLSRVCYCQKIIRWLLYEVI